MVYVKIIKADIASRFYLSLLTLIKMNILVKKTIFLLKIFLLTLTFR